MEVFYVAKRWLAGGYFARAAILAISMTATAQGAMPGEVDPMRISDDGDTATPPPPPPPPVDPSGGGGAADGLTLILLFLLTALGVVLRIRNNFFFMNPCGYRKPGLRSFYGQLARRYQMKTAVNGIAHSTFSALVLVALTSCGGSGNGGGDDGGGGVTYSVGGTVTGLTGAGLVLQNNGGNDLAVSSDGAFTFPTELSNGAAYAVTVNTQPSSPTQNCVVTSGSGTVATSNITAVVVTCTTAALFTVGGVVTELDGSGLVLQINGGDDLAISASGTFTFATPVASGSDYAVTVKTQPSGPSQTCSVGRGTNGDGTGTVGDANVENLWVACGLHFAYVTNAGDDTISVYAIASFTGALTPIGTPVATGTSPYAITGSPDKRHVYVVNQTSNNIWAYSVDAVSGALTPIPSSPIATGTDPQALAFDPSGAYLYVANNGSNSLSAFAVNANTGALTPLPTATYATGAGPSAISIEDSGKFAFVANNGGSNDISVFAISSGTGALTEVVGSPFSADGNPHSLAIAPTIGTSLYTANIDGANSSISGFNVNMSTGTLTKMTGSPFPLEVSNYIGIYRGYDDSLFVTTSTGVVGYFVGGSPITFPGYSAVAGINAYSVTSDQMNSVLYVANDGAASISAYKIDDVSATLTEVPGSPFPAGTKPDFIAIL